MKWNSKLTSLLLREWNRISYIRHSGQIGVRFILPIFALFTCSSILPSSLSYAKSIVVVPGQSISGALQNLQPGDTLLVRGGVYNQSIVLPRHGLTGSKIVLKNYPGEKPVVMNDSRLIEVDKDHWIIDGLIFDQKKSLTDAVKIRSRFVTIRNCEIRNGAKDGIDGSNTSSDVLIENCVIHDFIRPSGDDAHGIVVNPGAERWQIVGNTIYDCGGDCIQLYASDETPISQYSKDFLISGNTLYTTLGDRSENALDFKGIDGCIVEGNELFGFDNKAWVVQKGCRNITGRENLIHDSQRGIEFRGEGGKSQQNISLIRNVIYNIREYYVIKFDDVRNVEVYHNTLVNNTATPIQIEQEGIRGGTIRNNLFYRCDAADIDGVFEGDADHNGWFATDPGDLAGAGDVSSDDPGFEDADSTDFRLQEDSPAVDAGVDVGLPFSGDAPDLGAIELSRLTTPIELAPFSDEIVISGPNEFALSDNYPNPLFLGSRESGQTRLQTNIAFNLNKPSLASFTIHDILGRNIRTLHHGFLPAGRQVITWDGRDELDELVAAGVYFYRLTTEQIGSVQRSESRQMSVLR